MTGLRGKTQAEIYVLDEGHDLTLMQKLTVNSDTLEWEIEMPNFTSYLILLKDADQPLLPEEEPTDEKMPYGIEHAIFIPNSVS